MLEVMRRNDITAWHSRFVEKLQAAGQRAPFGNARTGAADLSRPALLGNRGVSTG
jgi:hypothetical protein